MIKQKNKVRLLELYGIPPLETQLIYEAVAIAQLDEKIPDTIIICWPKEPLVCIGYHQITQEEIDINYCKKHKIPIVRRILGGGAVYLNKDQVFYQYIFRENSPVLPKTFEKMFETFLEPVIKTYNNFGIPAIFRPVNDIEANNKKISGTGAGTHENSRILTGNFLLDFDFKTMIKVLKVPNEKFRDKVYKTLKDRLTTFKDELGSIPLVEEIIRKYKVNLEKILNITLESGKLSEKENIIIQNLFTKYKSSSWNYLIGENKKDLLKNRSVKIAKDSGIAQAIYKGAGGLIKIILEIENMMIKDILISGDFFIYPENSLRKIENLLKGKAFNIDILQSSIEQFYKENNIESPRIKPIDFINTFKNLQIEGVFN